MRSERFTDPGGRLWQYGGRVLVRCPRCVGCATVIRPPVEGHRFVGDARVVCSSCAYARRQPLRGQMYGDLQDPIARLPLWLQAPCRGRTLWAFNAEHLAVLEGYVGAAVRERPAEPTAYTMLEVLPRWMKLAKHRGEVLRVIDRLKRTLPA